MEMGEKTSMKTMKSPKNRTPLLLPGITTPHHQGNKKKTEWIWWDDRAGFRRRVITSFSELKDHVPTQCKETKNPEKRLDEMLTRINSLERNINDLMELKNTAELCEAYTSFNIWINQAEERILEIEDQLTEIKWEAKKKSTERNEKVSKKCGTMWRDLTYFW